ncbi:MULTISPECIES: BGTF surface domain-containing protein [Halorussus]|uniref:BGTF surface domain-containing protein n=1 Tax=Halorussus TaxID=1070314 RepID=UPI0020A1F031|nr:BGTF surface domain-containing protein [Halorussus vallis]USZ77116.1 hypothetical protein NGM07_07260 [Halorussus vallis]
MFDQRPQSGAALAAVVVLLAATLPPLASAGTAANGSFSPSVVREDRGDVMNITVTTPKAGTLNLGSPEQHFWIQASVGKGTTEIRLNTYKAGRAGRYSVGEMVWAEKGSLGNLRLRTDPLSKPLETAEYPMNVTANGHEQAIGAFVVEERETNTMDARIAPKATKISDLSNPDQIADATVPPWNNGSVAAEDWFVVHVNASGLAGMLRKDHLGPGGNDGVRMKFTQSDGGMNADSHEFWGDDVERFVRDGGGDGFSVFVDTGAHGIEPGSAYNVTFTVTPESELTDETETVSTRMRVVPRRIHVNRNGPGDKVVVEGKTKISGTTTYTPGTTINISARDEDLPPILMSKTVTVKSDRTFATTFDFSDLEPGREFEIRLPDQRATLQAVVAIRKTTTPETTETATPTATPTTTTTTPGTTAGMTQVPVRDTERPLTARPVEEANGGSSLVPGFDAGLAVVALAVALLAARRRAGR